MTPGRHSAATFLFATLVACCLLAFSGTAQSPSPASPAEQPPPAGRGGGLVQDNTGADFSPKPPIAARSAKDQANTFILPAGYRLELVDCDWVGFWVRHGDGFRCAAMVWLLHAAVDVLSIAFRTDTFLE